MLPEKNRKGRKISHLLSVAPGLSFHSRFSPVVFTHWFSLWFKNKPSWGMLKRIKKRIKMRARFRGKQLHSER